MWTVAPFLPIVETGEQKSETIGDMARFSVSEAAKLLGINRKTLYKHISQGKVSAGLDPLGQKYIEAAELHRAYGDIPDLEDRIDKSRNATLDTVVDELRHLRKAHDKVLEELKALREEVAETRLLENKAAPNDVIKLSYQDKPEPQPERSEPEPEKPRHSFTSIMDKLKASSD